MSEREAMLDRFLARWVLGHATPEEAVRSACRALDDGCGSPAIAVIAVSNARTRPEIDDELPRLLRAWDKQLPSADAALKFLVDDCARQIVHGEIDPVRGAWAIWEFWANDAEDADFFDQVRTFIDLADECDEAGPRIAAYRADIVEEARAFLARGGLRPRY